MNVIKLKFSLKQITPMIHFQNENGATIRATELKPKLDRFILLWMVYENNKVKCNEQKIDSETEILKRIVKEKDYDNWIIDEKHIALNYKMRIKAICKDENINLLNHSNKRQKYLGNADYILDNRNKDEEDKYVSTFSKKILVEIICFDELLADKIIELLPILIDLTAFGLQQSKGYGNFRVNKIFKENKKQQYKPDIERNYIKLLKNFNTINNNVLIYKLKKGFNGYEKSLDEIAKLNGSIKKGMVTKVYEPDYLKNNESIINEKTAMKIHLRNKGYKIKNIPKSLNLDNNKVYYTRGLLGIAQKYDFAVTKCTNPRGNEINIEFVVKVTDKEEGKALRFPSPLHYHVAKDYKTIYIVINNKSLQVLQQLNPKIEFVGKIGDVSIGNISAQLSQKEEFDLEKFFDFVVLRKNENISKLEGNQNG